MSAYVLSLGRVSVGIGLILLLFPENKLPAFRTLIAMVALCVLCRPVLGDISQIRLPKIPQESSLTAQKEAEAWIMEAYTENLEAEVKKRAGENAKVFITLHADQTIDSVTVYGVEDIVGLRAYIEETFSPKEVNLYGAEEQDA